MKMCDKKMTKKKFTKHNFAIRYAVKAISEYYIFPSSCYEPYGSLMSGRKPVNTFFSGRAERCCCCTRRAPRAAVYECFFSPRVLFPPVHRMSAVISAIRQTPKAPSHKTFSNISAAVPLASLAFRRPPWSTFCVWHFLWAAVKPALPRFSFSQFCPSCAFFFFQVVINKNPRKRWHYTRDRAEGLEFITHFDWVTPRLDSGSKQLLDSPPWPPSSRLSSPKNSTSHSSLWPDFLSPTSLPTIAAFSLLFFSLPNFVTSLAFWLPIATMFWWPTLVLLPYMNMPWFVDFLKLIKVIATIASLLVFFFDSATICHTMLSYVSHVVINMEVKRLEKAHTDSRGGWDQHIFRLYLCSDRKPNGQVSILEFYANYNYLLI